MRCRCFLVSPWLVLPTIGAFLMVTPPATAAGPGDLRPPVRLKVGDRFIDAGDVWGHAGPTVADVDGDGLRDLVVGDFSGKFRFFRNVGSNRQPRYDKQDYIQAGGQIAEVRVY